MIPYSGYSQQLFYFEDQGADNGGFYKRVSSTSFADENAFRDNLIQYYTDKGFFDIRIDSLSSQQGMLVAYLDTGSRFILDSIFFICGNDTLRAEYSGYFESAKVGQKIVDHLTDLQNDGFPLALATTRTITRMGDNVLNLEVDIEPGPYVEITSILFNGNKQLTSVYLAREGGFHNAFEYSDSRVNMLTRRLRRSMFLVNVDEPQLISDNNTFSLQYTVREIRPSYVDLILGYDPGAGSGDRFVGTGRLSLNNLISEGSIAFIDFSRLPGSESRLDISYKHYWLNNWPLSSQIKLNFYQRDSTYYRIAGRVDLNYQLTERINTGIFLLNSAVEGEYNPDNLQALDNRSYYAGIVVEFEETDKYYAATRGYRYRLEIGSGIKRLINNPDELFLRGTYNTRYISFYTQYFFSLTDKVVFTPRFNGTVSQMPVYFDDDLFRFGGANSLRGYREDQFRSSSYGWGDVELRYLFESESYFFGFGALGVTQYPETPGILRPGFDSQLLYSGGVGFSYSIPLGHIRFSYALSPEDRFNNGKVHFGIVNSF